MAPENGISGLRSREWYGPTRVTGVTTRKPDVSSATGSPRRLSIVARWAASTTAATTRSLLSSSKAVPTGAVAIAATSDSSNTQPECKIRSEEHTSELQSLMRISYAVFCLKKQNKQTMTFKIIEKFNTNLRMLTHTQTDKHNITTTR